MTCRRKELPLKHEEAVSSAKEANGGVKYWNDRHCEDMAHGQYRC